MQSEDSLSHRSSNSTTDVSRHQKRKKIINNKELHQNKEKIDELYSEYLLLINENISYQNHILEDKKKIAILEKQIKTNKLKTHSESPSKLTNLKGNIVDHEKNSDHENLMNENKYFIDLSRNLKNQISLLEQDLETLKLKESNLTNELQITIDQLENEKKLRLSENKKQEDYIDSLKEQITELSKEIKRLLDEYQEVFEENLLLSDEKEKLKSNLSQNESEYKMKNEELISSREKWVHEKKSMETLFDQLKIKLWTTENELLLTKTKYKAEIENESIQKEKLMIENKKLLESFSHNQNLIQEGFSFSEILDTEQLDSNNICNQPTQDLNEEGFSFKNLNTSESGKIRVQKKIINDKNNAFIVSNEITFILNGTNEGLETQSIILGLEQKLQSLHLDYSRREISNFLFLNKEKDIIELNLVNIIFLLYNDIVKKESEIMRMRLELKRLKIQCSFIN